MKNDLKLKLMRIIVFVLLFIFISSTSAFATQYIQTWNLVDSSKHLDWFDNTQYDYYVKEAVKKWEGHKSGIIRKTSSTSRSTMDVMVNDYWSQGNVLGYTSSGGYIYLNKYNFDTHTGKNCISASAHEIGHALGIDHNKKNKNDIMYSAPAPSNPKLTTDDKDSYNAAYSYYSKF